MGVGVKVGASTFYVKLDLSTKKNEKYLNVQIFWAHNMSIKHEAATRRKQEL